MKKIVSVLVVAVMVLSLAVSAFAAAGISKDEEALLAKFNAAVDEYAALSVAHATQYKSEAENALVKLDLDAAACADLSTAIDTVLKYAKDNGIDTVAAAKQNADKVVALVNSLVSKYGVCVSLDGKGYVSISFTTINGDGSTSTDKASSGSTKIVKQTGVDMTATYVVSAVLVVALVFGFAVVSKKNLLSNN